MNCQIEPKAIQEIESTNILQQSRYWATLKHSKGLNPRAFDLNASRDFVIPNTSENAFIHDDMLVLVQNVNDSYSYAYLPYGPEIQPDADKYGSFVENLSESLIPHLPEHCIFIRYDLPWENQWVADDAYFHPDGHLLQNPSVNAQEFRINFDTHQHRICKSPTDNLPASTWFLKLNHSDDALLANMKAKTRYNIRLSERKGVRVKQYGMEKIHVWYKLYAETARRNGIVAPNLADFERALKLRQSKEIDSNVNLLIAEHNADPLAAMFLATSKKRGTYLYGASASQNRQFMAAYALQWEAIRLLKTQGCTEYDMFGSAPGPNPDHPMYGLYRFKGGFGGNLFHRMGCWDFPILHDEYSQFVAKEISAQAFHV
jgi:lipid II:glycine glycyltransferase (peptidoglycan interpeptide bridge formation enzyme)